MSEKTRYLWGTTKTNKIHVTNYIDLVAQSSAPDAYPGRLYRDADGKLQLCEDGTNYVEVTTSS